MIARKLKHITIVTIITYLLAELVCFIFMKTKFKDAHLPGFSYQYNYRKYDFPIAELDTVWGTWHYQEDYTEKKQCFSSTYHINSFGARDRERARVADTNRVVFLGDSFIEGYGLNADERFSNLLEQKTGKEMLNFGCGYFTPTQELLLYKKMASGFTHNTVIIGILPFNDLHEDDSSFHENDGFRHYRPYLQGEAPGYQLIYREDNLSKSTFNKQGYAAIQNTTKQRFFRFLKEFSFAYNLYRYFRDNKPALNATSKPFSGYYDYTKPQVEKLEFILASLKEAAKGKELMLVTIPVLNDFTRYREQSGPSLANELSRFCKSENIRYTDLLEEFEKRVKSPETLYFTCDGHWNATANKLAAEIILPLLRN